MQTRRLVQARIERILKAFTREDVPELQQFVSGVNDPHYPGIDDGDYGDPLKDTRPEWVKKDLK